MPPHRGQFPQNGRGRSRAIDRGRHQIYAPGIWGWIMLVIRALPRAVLRRVPF